MDLLTFGDILGYIATVLIVGSMVFKTTTFKGTIIMRIINGLGSAFFICYGFICKAYPTAVANILTFIINIVFIYIECRDHRRNLKCEKD